MPVIDARIVPDDEWDLPAVSVGVLNAGDRHVLQNLRGPGQSQNLVYVGCLVVNGATDFVTLEDNVGRRFPVQAGQPGHCDVDGATSLAVLVNSAVTAGQVVLIPRVRRLG